METLYQIIKGSNCRGEKTGILCTRDKIREAVELAVKKDQYLNDLLKVDKVHYQDYVESVGDSLVIEASVGWGGCFILNWSLAQTTVLS